MIEMQKNSTGSGGLIFLFILFMVLLSWLAINTWNDPNDLRPAIFFLVVVIAVLAICFLIARQAFRDAVTPITMLLEKDNERGK